MDKFYIELKEWLSTRVGKKRYNHSLNVADEAVKLAERYGEHKENAYFAGLMHDCCKELSTEELKKIVISSDMDVDEAELITKPLWHAIAGAEYVRANFPDTDKEIISAIRFHTIGKAKMSVFEQIIYIADMISAERDFDGVEKLRKLAYISLDNTMLECVKFSLVKVINKNGFLPEYSLKAYNYYLKKSGVN
ncbi:MAG: bis(5'-nucleosyl)-tetraphosphatase (symmetrical) YqeK [Oscillospiraceae bacterium]|nr:bis(5'-nucleosyl)-tetraphosphatase (symmetrical) YqeK [Oscillospiraceae bacterium]